MKHIRLFEEHESSLKDIMYDKVNWQFVNFLDDLITVVNDGDDSLDLSMTLCTYNSNSQDYIAIWSSKSKEFKTLFGTEYDKYILDEYKKHGLFYFVYFYEENNVPHSKKVSTISHLKYKLKNSSFKVFFPKAKSINPRTEVLIKLETETIL